MKKFKNLLLTLCSALFAFCLAFAGFSLTNNQPITPSAATVSPCSGDHSGWTAISNNYTISSAGKYYLSANITKRETRDVITINCDGEVTLCLNGKSLINQQIDRRSLSIDQGQVNLCDCAGTGFIQSAYIGLFISETSVLNMYSGTIKSCYNYSSYSAVALSKSATFNMYGGLITNNSSENSKCGAVGSSAASASINIYGGSITGNSPYGVALSGGSLYISGDAKISDNKTGDVYLAKGKTITAGELTSGAKIGVTSAATDDTIAITGANATDYSQYFYPNNSNYLILNLNNVVYLHKHDGTATCVSKPVCSTCGEYGEVNPDNHERDTYTNGIRDCCGAYAPASLVEEWYQISNLGNLMWFAEQLNSQAITVNHKAKLTADVTIDNSVVWTPMSLADTSNQGGTFNGDSHTITFANTREESAFGLFGTYNYSTIENLYLKGSITCNTTNNIGVLVNSAYRTTVRNVVSTCSITNESESGGTGGLAGQFGGQHSGEKYSLIENCAVYADVIGGGSAGGFIGNIWSGYQYCEIRHSIYAGNAQGAINTGAVAGYNGNTSTTTSIFTNVYYNENDNADMIGNNNGKLSLTNAESVTKEQLTSGEITYKLGEAWGQELGVDPLPKLGGKKIYGGFENCNEAITIAYSNEVLPTERPNHDNTAVFTVNENVLTQLCPVCEKELATITVKAFGKTYDRTSTNPIVEKTGTMPPNVRENCSVKKDGKTIFQIVDAGDYTCIYTLTYADDTTTTLVIDFTIAKATPRVTPPTTHGDGVYEETGFHPVITTAQTTGGTVMYNLNGGEWTENAPATQYDVGTYTVGYKVIGDNNYNDVEAQYVTFIIQPFTIENTTITIEETVFVYNGNELTPNVTVTNGNATLEKDVDYTLTFANNVEAGTATVTVTGLGNYSNSTTKSFEIICDHTLSTTSIATCIEKAVCSTCGEYGEVNPDNHASNEFTYPSNGNETHNKLHACCDGISEENVPCSGGKATCTHKKECSYCNAPYGELDPTAHVFGEWQETTPATKTENGEKQRTCVCGEMETEVIPKTGNPIVIIIAISSVGGVAIAGTTTFIILKKRKKIK